VTCTESTQKRQLVQQNNIEAGASMCLSQLSEHYITNTCNEPQSFVMFIKP